MNDPVHQEAANERHFDLSGKDFLTEREAAHYACVSYSHFREHAAENGIRAFQWMGRKVYRKADIQRAMERVRDASADAEALPDPSSKARTGFAVLAAAESARRRRRRP